MAPVRLFCADLDGTLIGNLEATRRFKLLWESIPAHRRPVLCYSSGRLIDDALDVIEEMPLPRCDYIIGGVGTQIYRAADEALLDEYDLLLDEGWSHEAAERVLASVMGIERQPERYLHRYKSSWYLRNAPASAIEEIRRRLAEAGVGASVVYSSSRDLDVVPRRATKGEALAWLCERLCVPLDSVLVAGDSGNDAAMFRLPEVRGIIVANAQPELYESTVGLPTYAAERPMGDGVLEGLVYFRVLPDLPGFDSPMRSAIDDSPALGLPSPEEEPTDEEWMVIREGYLKAIETIRRNITPLGFSAASLDDNEVVGTDVNYRSVWGRDGAITILGTLGLDDPDIRAAQRRTFRTLLGAMTPHGQLPANVHIDTGVPDYSGIGGISAIDSAMWVVIAFYNYVRITGDRPLLDEFRTHLDRVMIWLSAQDSNNDGLLEIPEAGDWTDLFGRSYHVLYDEVLWYRATVCYGLLLEMLGELDAAAEYLRRAQRVSAIIMQRFWPTTRPEPNAPGTTFADRQYSIGDASYLLAELTPFQFNWRCDVFGNVLAFLWGVLDIDRARRVFRFMWGAGVNAPYPVVNLYPAVQAGDPDWKAYYTVNMLNLPHHYHNGGIWPFIGGMWVRYIDRLGGRRVAERELYNLALLNRQGRVEQWEFNEWAHGATGKPMGKRYQAWSAASFIHACHELGVAGELRRSQ